MKKSLKSYLLIIFIIILSISCSPKNVNGKLSISSNPTKAKVYIDNEYKGITPLEIELMPKSYELKLIKDGYKDYSKSINIEANKTVELSIVLEKEQPQSIFEGKWELISYKEKKEDTGLYYIGRVGTIYNFFKDGSFQRIKTTNDFVREESGEYKIIDDTHIKFIIYSDSTDVEIYKFYVKRIDNVNYILVSNENETFTVALSPYTRFDYSLNDISKNILGLWEIEYNKVTGGYWWNCSYISFEENNVLTLHSYDDWYKKWNIYYESYSFENGYLYLNFLEKSKKFKCKIKELSLSRLMLQDDQGNSALFIRSYKFEFFEEN